jgi:DNA polymerase-4
VGEALHRRARGIDDAPVRPHRVPCSVSRETSFDPETADRRIHVGMLAYLLERAAASLRASGLKARTLTVRIRYADGPGNVRSRTLAKAFDREREVRDVAKEILRSLYTRRVRLKLIGVALSGLSREEARQGGLFTEEEHRRDARLTGEIDRIRERFGFRAITAGAAIDLLPRFPQNENGFVLKTPSLTR